MVIEWHVAYDQLTGMLSSVLQSGLSGLKPTSVGDEAGTTLLSHGDDSTENRLQAALEQTLLKNIQYKVAIVWLAVVAAVVVFLLSCSS